MENQEKKEPTVFKAGVELPRITGKLKFQFGDDKPVEIANVFDKKPVYLSFDENNKEILFEGENGQKLKLFID